MMMSLLFLALAQPAANPRIELLWPDGAPGAVGTEPRDKPSLTIFLPPPGTANRTGVIICPGGGYSHLATDHEGKQPAEWLTRRGVAAFVLQYRLGPRYHEPAPLLDAQRAVRWVRANADKLGVKADRVGVWGFSAGGHLASTIGTHFDAGSAAAADPVDRLSCRPDFLILAYAVISMESPTTHVGSRKNLLGDHPSPELVEKYSNHKHVTKDTPPTFLFHTSEDTGVLPENSILFYQALRKAGVSAELHIFAKGKHGVGLAANEPGTSAWPDRLNDWLKIRGLLDKP